MTQQIDIKPIKVKEYTTKQSKYSIAPSLPIRGICLAPSGSGKTVLLSNLILNVYKGCFERIYVWSPSFFIDSTWRAVEEYQEKTLNVKHNDSKDANQKGEKLYFDEYHEDDLNEVINTQKKIVEAQKKKGMNKLFSILIIVDDFADNEQISRQSKALHSLFTRGRHWSISTICSVQKYKVLSNIIRMNASFNIVFRLRSQVDLQAWLEENSGLVDKKTLEEIYRAATAEPYSFLFANLVAKDVNSMFYIRFSKSIKID